MSPPTRRALSRDGTAIAFDAVGEGPPLVLVDGALCSRAFGPMPEIARHLASRFTVFHYDRRGRGESGDTRPYSAERELDDLAAVIGAAGGRAHVLGLSSGAALALRGAAAGLPIARVVAYEPPWVDDGSGAHARAGHEARLGELLGAGRRGDAVSYFMRDMVGAPAVAVLVMRMLPVWKRLGAVAHTLPYDAAMMGDWAVPERTLAGIAAPALAMCGEKTDARLQRASRRVAAAIPGARLQVLPGQNHAVKAAVLAPAVAQFLLA